jgi:peptidoglycan/LPS O-acetylase OafA/YrhL
MEYRREIDGLRAIAVLPVILFHAGSSWFSGGYVGVDVFFVISGYLITSILLSDLDGDSFSIAKFYERRARRILPALFFMMLCCIPFAWFWMTTGQLKDFSQGFIAIPFFASNILFWKKENYFAQPAEENPLLHTWSLAVEEQFYIFFPLLLLLFWRFGKKTIFSIITILTISSLLLSEWGWRNQPSANFYLLPTRAWELGAGALCAFLLYKAPQKSNQLLSALGLLLIAISIVIFNEETPFPSFYAIAPVAGTSLIILYASKETFVAKILHTKTLVGIGLISYSAYLWHQPLFAFARIKSFSAPSTETMAALSLASLILAYFTWKYVEAPFRNKSKTGLTRNRIFIFSGAASFILISAGVIGHTSEGLAKRLTLEQREWTNQIETLKKHRQVHIRAGECHFNEGTEKDAINSFLEKWNCKGQRIVNQKYIAVYGDSHSADKAFALRATGINPLQLSGAGCPLIPDSAKNKYCDRLIKKFIEEAKKSSIDTIVLSNRFTEAELNQENLERIIMFWTNHFDDVIFFSPMPEFARFDQLYSLHGTNAQKIIPDRSLHDFFYKTISKVEKPSTLQIINTAKYFCGDADLEKCKAIQGGKIMLTDYGHLSEAGAKEFGKRLAADINITTQIAFKGEEKSL